MHDARAVANTLLDLAKQDGNRLDITQLIKLVYFCHAWMLALHQRPLIEQPIEAWRYGPAIRDVHNAFKKFRDQAITARAKARQPEYDDAERHIIAETYRQYGYLTATRLCQLCHAPGTPWDQVRIMANRRRGIDPVGVPVIPNRMLQEHYAAKVRERATAPA